MHTSASLTINENCDPDVRYDMESALNRMVGSGAALFRHMDEVRAIRARAHSARAPRARADGARARLTTAPLPMRKRARRATTICQVRPERAAPRLTPSSRAPRPP